MLRRFLLALSLTVAISGCAAGPAVLGQTGTVSGHLMVSACGGASTGDTGSACHHRPVAGATVTFRQVGGAHTATANTDQRGFYSIQLDPGTYSVKALDGTRELGGPAQVTVMAGKGVTADYGYTIRLL